MAVSAGKLTYLLQLESNLGAKATAELKLYERANQGAEGKTKDLNATVNRLGDDMARLAEKTASSSLRQAGYLDRLGQSYDALRNKMQALNNVKQIAANAIDKAPQALAAGGAFAATVAKPVAAFATLEEATTDLKIVMLDAKGKVAPAFDEIMKIAVEMGNKLPGSTKDFVAAARALKEQGTDDKVITGGGLKAAGYLGVLLGMDQYSAAEMVAKNREAYALKETELVAAADQTQRARFAFGMKPQDIQSANSYMATTLNTMGITGLENMKKVQAIQGIAAGVGLEGSSFGTNFSMMLNRLNQVDKRLGKGKEGKEVSGMLAEHGISMDFFDAKGSFMGMDNMVAQLQKLKPLSQADRAKVLDRMFGVEAGRPAAILVEKGMAAYEDAQKKVTDQAGLEARVDMKTKTLKGKQEGLSGTFENMLASMGAPIGEALKPAIDKLNEGVGAAQGFFEKNRAAAGAATVVGGLGAAAAAYGAAGWLKSLFMGGGKSGGGVLGALTGGGLGALKLPLPVYVVNKHMSLTKDAMNGIGQAAGAATTVAAGKAASTVASGAAAGAAASGASKWAGRALRTLKIGGYVGAAYAASGLLSNAYANEMGEQETDKDKAGRRGEIAGQATAALAGSVAGKVVGKAVGAIGGRLAGMAMGAAMGSVVPIVGTVIGGVAGLALGGMLAEPMGEMGKNMGERMQSNSTRVNAAYDEQAQYDPMTGMMLGGGASLLRDPAYAALSNPATANNAQSQAALEALKQPQKVELQPSQMTIKIDAPEGYNATAQLTSPSFKLDGGSTAPWARN
jgi:TP901 family phage tail tape measure protein